MRLDFNLDFIYYQKEETLDNYDENYLKLRSQYEEFNNYRKTTTIENVLGLLVFTNAKEYANSNYWSSFFTGTINPDVVYPQDMDPAVDTYLEEGEIKVKGVKKVFIKEYDDIDENCYYMNWIKLEFTSLISMTLLVNNVKKALKEIRFNESINASNIIIEPYEGAIKKISITENTFRLDINKEKWKIYRGF